MTLSSIGMFVINTSKYNKEVVYLKQIGSVDFSELYARLLINAQTATERHTNRFRQSAPRATYSLPPETRRAVRGSQPGSRNPRSRDRYRDPPPVVAPFVARTTAESEAAKKCFRTNWRALIDEATESFPWNRGSSKGRFAVASHRERLPCSRDA